MKVDDHRRPRLTSSCAIFSEDRYDASRILAGCRPSIEREERNRRPTTLLCKSHINGDVRTIRTFILHRRPLNMPTHPKEALPPWGNALAGATSAVIANAAVYPLDIVKTRLQVQGKAKDAVSQEEAEGSTHYKSTADAIRKIVADEGYVGLFSGLPSALIGVASTNFAYFYWYSVVRASYLSSALSSSLQSKAPSAVTELALGAAAGALAQILTIPVSVVTTRQQTQARGAKKGLLDTGREVVNGEDGWTGLWRGLNASLVLVVNPAITYGAYERLREAVFPGKRNLRPWEAFILGATCKAVATIVTQPLIVAKVGLQSQPPPARRGKPFGSFVEVMRYIVRTEGLAGLFKGIGPQLMKGLLVQGLLMMTKERMGLFFVLLFRSLRRLRSSKLRGAVERARRITLSAPLVGR